MKSFSKFCGIDFVDFLNNYDIKMKDGKSIDIKLDNFRKIFDVLIKISSDHQDFKHNFSNLSLFFDIHH